MHIKTIVAAFVFLISTLVTLVSTAQANDALTQLETLVNEGSPSEGLELLEQLDIKASELTAYDNARLYFLYGQLYEKTRQLDLAIASYDIGIALVEPLAVSDILIDSYLERSFALYLQTNDPNVYCSDRRKALVFARRHNNATLLAKTLTQNAFCYNTATTVHKGIALLDEAMVIVDKSETLDVNRKAMIYNATGSLYRTVGLHKRAYDNFDKAYQTWQTVDDKEDMFNMQHNMISSAIKLSDWQRAQVNIAAQFALAEAAPEFEDFYFFAYLNSGRIALGAFDYPLAISNLERAISLKDTTLERFFVSGAHLFLAQAYMRTGETEKAANMARIFEQDKSFPANMRSMLLTADAIIAFDKQEYLVAINTLLKLIDEEREYNKNIIDNEVIDSALAHNSKLAEFENELLSNKLAINQLNLKAAIDKERINELKLSIFVLVALVLLATVFFLMHSRKVFKRRAQTDFLTGIANRGHTFKTGEKMIEKSIRKQQSASVIVFDIDNFKSINDRFGHHIGDLAIQAVTKRAERWLKKQDLVGRIGGEEFLIVLPNTDEKAAIVISERIRSAIACQSFKFDEITIEFTISLGIAVVNEQALSLSALLKEADKALYKAKFSGKNKVYLARQCA
ncbi:GGDEF domain-containing protein [Shewanella sp. KX20019]|uniref:tetratricopeptide repeat-containing diguanylate cyclase n=1 Tax=Shewanella sp. KX20019 TaxID=2803864 RepID=UPI00192810DF|nr:GGDEF domain-containing protein [Shewanella sp. KX20019]QQX80943.1 GGDEF domain-containing protein [Shewanella sp. KX20019]